MPDKNRESAVHDTAVGAAGDKPISNPNIGILAYSSAEINPNSTFVEEELEMDRVLARINDPNYFRMLSMNQCFFFPYRYGLSALLLKSEGGEYGCLSS